MHVLMMRIRKMRMLVFHRLVVVPMAMFLPNPQFEPRLISMVVLMVRIVRMLVFMLHRCVCMNMLMVLCQVQPDADAHQCASGQ